MTYKEFLASNWLAWLAFWRQHKRTKRRGPRRKIENRTRTRKEIEALESSNKDKRNERGGGALLLLFFSFSSLTLLLLCSVCLYFYFPSCLQQQRTQHNAMQWWQQTLLVWKKIIKSALRFVVPCSMWKPRRRRRELKLWFCRWTMRIG